MSTTFSTLWWSLGAPLVIKCYSYKMTVENLTSLLPSYSIVLIPWRVTPQRDGVSPPTDRPQLLGLTSRETTLESSVSSTPVTTPRTRYIAFWEVRMVTEDNRFWWIFGLSFLTPLTSKDTVSRFSPFLTLSFICGRRCLLIGISSRYQTLSK